MKLLTGSTRLVVVALLLLVTLLAACGDNTPVPATTAAATTAAATTAAATTAAATTAAPVATTAAATTAAPTTAAATTAAVTTAAATTAAATTAAGSATTAATGAAAACATCPASYVKITIPDGVLAAAKKGMPATITDFVMEAYGSDDAVDKVALDTDASVVASGYTFAIPGSTKPVKIGNYYSGAYTKAGSPDVLIQIVDVSTLPDFLKSTGADDASQATFTTAAGSKKSLVFIFGGTGIVTASLAGSSTTAAAGTVAATTAASGSSTTAAAGTAITQTDIPSYAGAVLVTLPDAVTTQFASSVGSTVKNARLEAYKVTDDGSMVKDFFTTGLTKDGWLDVSSQLPASATASLTTAGVTLVGPFVKNPEIVVVLILKGSALNGLSGVAATDTLYMVLRGNV